MLSLQNIKQTVM